MSGRILVVDDIVPNVKLLHAKLAAEYYEVITAKDGAQALEVAREQRPDLILLDVMMPGMDGFEVCRALKADNELAFIPVVMITALSDKADKIRALEAGADDFLSKPIDDIALMARVSSLLRLKMALDEWRVRERTAKQLGVVEEQQNVMDIEADGAHILIVEDKELEKKRLFEGVDKEENTVLTVSSGFDAIEMMKKHNFDVIIISLNLGQEDPLRLCSHLRSQEGTRIVPILMVGEEQDMPQIVRGLEIGAHDYILRPIEKSELLARTRTLVRRKRFQERLKATYEVSLSMALTDSLTGLHNRRYLEVHLAKRLEKNHLLGKAMSVLILDIDKFKLINDTYGHNKGDEVLIQFAKRMQANVRSFDLVARMGGEEFVVVLPEVIEGRAYVVSERLRRCIAEKPFILDDGTELNITTSVGGQQVGQDLMPVSQILERADKALYEAKNSGRNAVFFFDHGKIDPEGVKDKSTPFD